MDLNTIEHVVTPRDRSELPTHRPGDAYLAGGTWLFSEPQTGLRRLVDLTTFGWANLQHQPDGLDIAATCPLSVLEAFQPPAAWLAAPVIRQCCRALLGSFKIRRVATVGGNLCLALPASPMAALVVALEGMCEVWTQDGNHREVPARSFILDAHRSALGAGEILRGIHLPDAALRRRTAFRQTSLTPLGRSAALLIGTYDQGRLAITITASVAAPIRITFAASPTKPELSLAIDQAVPVWFSDIHGKPEWRRRITHLMAAELCDELCAS